MPVREFRQQIGGGLADALAQAVGGGLEPASLQLPGDLLGLGEGGSAGFHGEHGLQGGGRPFPVGRRDLGEHVAHEVHHAPLVFGVGEHFVDGGDEPGAPVAHHEPDALEPEPAGLDGQAPFVVAGAVRLPLPGALVSGGVGPVIYLEVQHPCWSSNSNSSSANASAGVR